MYRLVAEMTRMIYGIIGRWRMGPYADDLFQAAVVSLLRSIVTYDPKRGTRLSSYAYRNYRAAVVKAARSEEAHGLGGIAGIAASKAVPLIRLVREHNGDPHRMAASSTFSYATCAGVAASRLPTKDVDAAADWIPSDAPTPEDAYAEAETKHVLRKAIESLTEQEQTVLRMRYGMNGSVETEAATAAALGVGISRVGYIRREALAKLRAKAERLGLEAA
jgi:RNA polymerase sigma factor (sigma-70 family)